MGFYSLGGVNTPFDPENKVVTSHILSPAGLAAWRLLCALYTLVSLIFTLAWRGSAAKRFFTYATNLTFIGLCAYFFASGVQSVAYVRRLRRKTATPGYPLQSWPRPLQFLHLLLYTTIVSYPFVVTIVFWVLLASPETFQDPYSSWLNITVHILNSVLALSELLFSRCRVLWFHAPFIFIGALLYVALAYISYADQGVYPYSFFDPKVKGAGIAIYICGIAIAAVVFMGIAWTICFLRDKAFRDKQEKLSSDEKGRYLQASNLTSPS